MQNSKDYKKPFDYNMKEKNEPINNVTDFVYMSIDGKSWATYEEAMEYNRILHENMIEQLKNTNGMHR